MHHFDEEAGALLESIATEEDALGKLINAEAKKVQAFSGKHLDFPTKPTNREIIKFNQGVTRLLETILFKEWILIKKLEDTMLLIELDGKCKKHKDKKHERKDSEHDDD